MQSNLTFIHNSAEVSKNSNIGDGTSVWNGVQIRENAYIGEKCNIGKDVYIDKNVKIGNRVKIQNGVSVFEGVQIADDVFLGPHMTFTNDLIPRAFNKEWKIVETKVQKGASIGANATIICGNTIGEYAMVGAGAVVTNHVPNYALVVGNPAKIIGYVCKCGIKRVDKIKCKECGEFFNGESV